MRRIDKINKILLRDIVVPILGNTTTFSDELEKVCLCLFGEKFAGVFASDQIPRFSKKQKYCIFNLDKSYKPGSHWVGLAMINDKKGLIYDSFGRKTKNIIDIKDIPYPFEDTENDPEQDPNEQNCGPRCVAFLLICEHWGYRMAKQL